MAFNLKKYEEQALTPELGGAFGDMKLLIRMTTPEVRSERFRKYAKQNGDKLEYDLVSIASDSALLSVSLIVGWENVDDPFSFDLRDKYIPLMLDDLTGHTLEGKEKPATLSEYVIAFSGDRKNFLAA